MKIISLNCPKVIASVIAECLDDQIECFFKEKGFIYEYCHNPYGHAFVNSKTYRPYKDYILNGKLVSKEEWESEKSKYLFQDNFNALLSK